MRAGIVLPGQQPRTPSVGAASGPQQSRQAPRGRTRIQDPSACLELTHRLVAHCSTIETMVDHLWWDDEDIAHIRSRSTRYPGATDIDPD